MPARTPFTLQLKVSLLSSFAPGVIQFPIWPSVLFWVCRGNTRTINRGTLCDCQGVQDISNWRWSSPSFPGLIPRPHSAFFVHDMGMRLFLASPLSIRCCFELHVRWSQHHNWVKNYCTQDWSLNTYVYTLSEFSLSPCSLIYTSALSLLPPPRLYTWERRWQPL